MVCAAPDDVEEALTRLARNDPGGAPVDLVVVDHVLDPAAVDLRRFEAWCAIASEMMAPLVLAAQPAAVGAASVAQLARSTNASSRSDDPRAVAVRAVAGRDASRWAALVLNDPLVRAPYTASSARQTQPPFDEDPGAPEAHVFANGAFAVAALCAKSFVRLGWPTSITGAHDGAIGDLPVHSPGGAHQPAIPLEAVPSEATVAEVARAGFTMLACQPNSDAALVLRAPVLHRAPGQPADVTLADQLFVGRFARAVQQVAAAIPASADPKAAQQAASIVLGDLFDRAPPVGPQWSTSIDAARGVLAITIRPRRFAGIGIEEVTLEAALSG